MNLRNAVHALTPLLRLFIGLLLVTTLRAEIGRL